MALHLLQSIQVPFYQEGSGMIVESYDTIKHEIYLDDTSLSQRFLVTFDSPRDRTTSEKFETLELAMSYLLRSVRRRSLQLGVKPWFDKQVEDTWKSAFGKWPREIYSEDINLPRYNEFVRLLSSIL